MAFWLKLLYPEEEQEAWEETPWVSDAPGRDSTRWERHPKPRHNDVYPPFGPQWDVGDRVVVYLVGRDRCPAIVEVVAEPRWDPELVDIEGGPREGDRWGVVTDVRTVTATKAIESTPRLFQIGVEAASIAQKGRLALDERQYREAERLLWTVHRSQGRDGTSSDLVDLERGDIEGYAVRSREGARRAARREFKLVDAFRTFLEGKGHEVGRNRLFPRGGGAPLYTDLFNVARNQLIEAKAGATRNDIRMAIGQLADYRRFLEPRPDCGVLLEAEPGPDLLDLLDAEEIAAIWRDGDGFTDSRAGEFT